MRYLILSMMVVFMFVGCSSQPTTEMNDAKAAVDAVIAEGAEKYAQVDAQKLNDDLAAAMAEITTQEGKMMKNYSKAKEALVKVKADADTLKAGLPAKKEEAKQSAITSQTDAKTAIDDAKALLAKAPKGKGSKADIEAMKADLKGLDESLPEVQKLIDTEDYSAAIEKANAIKEKAAGVSDQINQAMEKVGAKAEVKK
ncbi:MAG: hypothetical protein A2X59_13515 [Nitrospirae bacterium GWC2_42_7]|nr:MAG: hypothetical protein A2X59_13515 [Nitrospirae bacterium GWC2_42_7]